MLPGWLGLPQETLDVSPWQIAKSVLVFLGIPLLLGFLVAPWREAPGREWYETTFLPRIGPWALYGLLFTIVVLFALQGERSPADPLGRRPHRPAAAGLLRPDVGRRLRARRGRSA